MISLAAWIPKPRLTSAALSLAVTDYSKIWGLLLYSQLIQVWTVTILLSSKVTDDMRLGTALGFMDKVITMTSDGQIHNSGRFTDTLRHTQDEPEIETEQSSGKSTSPSPKPVVPTILALSGPDQASKDAARHNGDWRLYHHYILSIGWRRFAILLSVHAIDAALVNFPSQFTAFSFFSQNSGLTHGSCVVEKVVGGRRAKPK
jgi:hypothetical protein